ncbi:MAG: (Fe-S)-binding protein [Firmicutes bacterium]|nr:(Fe-S)-binding protein [Bacillota bacterium]
MAMVLAFFAVLIAALAWFGFNVNKRVSYLRIGQEENRSDKVGERIKGILIYVFGQRKLLKERFGIIHFFIFWGFVIISLGTLQFIGEGLSEGFIFPLIGSNPYFYLIKDIFSVLVLAALGVAAYRRYVIRPARIEANLDAGIIYLFITELILTEFAASGIRTALHPSPHTELAPVYNAVAGYISGFGAAAPSLVATYVVLWWAHVILLLAFLVFLPHSKHMHLMAAPFNVFFRSLKPKGGQIKPMDLEDEEMEDFGASRVELYTWKQLLDAYACAECGRCQDNCPAYLSGKPISPKDMIHKIKDHVLEKGEVLTRLGTNSTEEALEKAEAVSDEAATKVLNKELIGDVLTEDEIWSCTTCYSCQEQCPVLNEHINKFIDVRRSLVLEESNFPQEAQTACRNVENNFNPWGIGWSDRADWTEDLEIKLMEDDSNADILYWPGCAGAFDDRSQKVATSFVKIMQEAGVNFGILGTEEKCCGDFARRIGNEYLFQMVAEENIETMNEYGVTRIVTTCPHCLNTLTNEYPEFGGKYDVIHHTQFIAQLIDEGKINLRGDMPAMDIAYHDSCYLGRYNGEYSAPRKILQSIPGVKILEMERSKERSFCCGAGGGRMWMEEHLGEQINQMRVDQALETNPQAVGANCPFCLTMIEDGLKAREVNENVAALDVAEIVVRAIKSSEGEKKEDGDADEKLEAVG